MIKLVAIAPPTLARDLEPGLPRTVVVESNVDMMRDWVAVVRGPAVYFVSPAGWRRGVAVADRDPKGPRTVIESARSACCEQWEISELAELDQTAKFESPPFKLEAYAVEPVKAVTK